MIELQIVKIMKALPYTVCVNRKPAKCYSSYIPTYIATVNFTRGSTGGMLASYVNANLKLQIAAIHGNFKAAVKHYSSKNCVAKYG